MGQLVYTAIASLDGYADDADGNVDWAAPHEEVHVFVNDLERDAGTYLYGRRRYETMVYWETAPTADPEQDVGHDCYARIWQAADKVVDSRTLHAVPSERTTIERDFDPAAVARFVTSAERDVSIGGATLAAEALRAGIVDELSLLSVPAVVGGGTRAYRTAYASTSTSWSSAASPAARPASGMPSGGD